MSVTMSVTMAETSTFQISNTSNPEPGKKNKKTKSKERKVERETIRQQKAVYIKQTFSQKLGSDLADGLLKDSRQTSDSLNLVDRLAYMRANDTVDDSVSTLVETSETSSLSSAHTGEVMTLHSKKSMNELRSKPLRTVFNLDDFSALFALEDLIGRYGGVSHMGILDKSYTFFITEDRTAALYYKVKDKIAIIGGDPLCPPALFPHTLGEFESFRKKRKLGVAFLGAGETFVEYLKKEKWVTMCFATDRVLNPLTNPVLHGSAGKSITRTVKNLLDPKKEGLSLEVYTPRLGKNALLQEQLVDVYEKWRDHRNESKRAQAYITVYDPFALPELMTYIYTKDRGGNPNGFAALRMLGVNKGYHLDPYVALPGSPKGITDLLLYGSMALLNAAKVSYLSLGYEPLDDLGEITGIAKPIANISRKVHKRIFGGLHVAGKKGYHDKFHPDEAQQSNLYLVFPPGIPSIRHMVAVVHMANIKIRKAALKRRDGEAKEVKEEDDEDKVNISKAD